MADDGRYLFSSNGLQPGEVQLSKTAVPYADNQWTVTLSIEGKGESETSDVVLVIDKSASMSDENRMDNTKAAAVEFVRAQWPYPHSRSNF